MTNIALGFLFVLVVIVPFGALVGTALYWRRNPFSGAMFGAVQLIAIIGVRLMTPRIGTEMHYVLNLGFLTMGPSTPESIDRRVRHCRLCVARGKPGHDAHRRCWLYHHVGIG